MLEFHSCYYYYYWNNNNKMDYHAKNQHSSFQIVNLLACQSLGSDFQYPREISEIGASKDHQNLTKTPRALKSFFK